MSQFFREIHSSDIMKLSEVLILVVTTFLVQDVLSESVTRAEERYADLLTKEIKTFASSGMKTETFEQMIAELALPDKIRTSDLSEYINEKSSLTCTLCNSVVKTIIEFYNEGMGEERLINLITNLCTSLNIQTEEVCRGVVSLNAPIAFYIIENKPDIETQSVCGMVLRSSACPVTADEYEWTIEVDAGPPKYIESEETDETLKIVQITDFHYDPAYEAYGNAYCDEPTCCRVGQNTTNTNGELAGYWGHYHDCDSPWHAIVDAIDQIKESEIDTTYIYFTGDVIDHGVWETTRQGNVQSMIKTFELLHDTFGDVPIFPIVGNHESNPTNVFAPAHVVDEELSTAWLYEFLANIWIDYGWLPESTRSTILQGGFYSFSPKSGFRIITLNNNICYIYNWWLLYEPQDPTGQLKWLAETLLQAETDGEYVHILSHAPPGSTCLATWAREYRKIVNRFAHIVKAEFNGHTHNDEFRLVYDTEETTKPVRVSWVGGGITTYSDLNPNYKVYTVDAGTYAVEEIENWMYNLTLANLSPNERPVWFKSYSFKEEYGLEDLSLSSLDDLIHRMTTDSSILVKYYSNYVKLVDSEVAKGCDSSCRQNRLCSIVTAVQDDSTQCDYFKSFL